VKIHNEKVKYARVIKQLWEKRGKTPTLQFERSCRVAVLDTYF
jgi:hypothetical protein